MHCPDCGKNGINPYTKISLLFDLPIECNQCHMSFSLDKVFRIVSNIFSVLVIGIVMMSSLSGRIDYFFICAVAGLGGAWLWSMTLPISLDSHSNYSVKLMRKLRNARK